MPSVLRVVRWPSFPFSPSSRYYWFYSIKYVPNDLLCLWFAWSSYLCRKGFWRQDVSFKLNILLQFRPILLRSLYRDVSGQDLNLCLTNLEFSWTCFFSQLSPMFMTLAFTSFTAYLGYWPSHLSRLWCATSLCLLLPLIKFTSSDVRLFIVIKSAFWYISFFPDLSEGMRTQIDGGMTGTAHTRLGCSTTLQLRG